MAVEDKIKEVMESVKSLEGGNSTGEKIKEIMRNASGDDLYAKISVLSNTVFFISLKTCRKIMLPTIQVCIEEYDRIVEADKDDEEFHYTVVLEDFYAKVKRPNLYPITRSVNEDRKSVV